jgi:hypothetical protein
MTQNKPTQLYLLGLISLIGSVKIKEKCEWCSVALIGGFILLFIIASVIAYRNKQKIKRLKNKNLL